MRRTLVVMAILALVAGACGGEDDASLDVAEAWARSALGPNGAVYLTIEGGDADTALSGVSVSSDVAASAQLHQTVMRDDGTMAMTRLPNVEIPAGSTVMMVPGGVHVMLMELAKPLELGDTLDMTLTFDSGTELTTTVEVRDE
ncbi:MAG: copper chaperone PCu(A)C [Acidimicrobiia bacterium]|nr:copper chaperone PCu(A)C [Acidimicrobiia bacterium]MDX2468704.1 copper chaperone PCu(A)C [Acidimicrobiia bacterium]